MVSFHKLIENKALFYGVQSLIPVILALFIILVRLIQNKINMEIELVFVALYTFASISLDTDRCIFDLLIISFMLLTIMCLISVKCLEHKNWCISIVNFILWQFKVTFSLFYTFWHEFRCVCHSKNNSKAVLILLYFYFTLLKVYFLTHLRIFLIKQI